MIVRQIRKGIDTKFEYNTSNILNGCSKKRPDIFFNLETHCIIVEIDENQHKSYDESCECSRINEIVNGIGGRPVIIIRYNPDKIRHKKRKIEIDQKERVGVLLKKIREELIKIPDKFSVRVIKLYFDSNENDYNPIEEMDITKVVCV